MTKRAALKRQSRDGGAFDGPDYGQDSKVRRLPTPHGSQGSGRGGWSPHPSNDDRDQAYLKTLKPKSEGQAELLHAVDTHNLTLALGPAGTGKTYLAVAHAATLLERGDINRIILSRPAVEAGERLGFLPGDMKDKVDPYLRPLYDALYDMMRPEHVERCITSGMIEVAPLAFMRGRTLANAVVILDEAQNTTSMQMKMFLTRLGENSKMIVTGDPTQIDLPPGQKSGLVEALQLLDGIEGVHISRFSDKDVVRHALVGRIVRAYEGTTVKEDKSR